jgi:hypothetical protein
MRDSDECMASTLQFSHVRDGRQKNLHNLSLRWKAHICLVSTALAVLSLGRRLPNFPMCHKVNGGVDLACIRGFGWPLLVGSM